MPPLVRETGLSSLQPFPVRSPRLEKSSTAVILDHERPGAMTTQRMRDNTRVGTRAGAVDRVRCSPSSAAHVRLCLGTGGRRHNGISSRRILKSNNVCAPTSTWTWLAGDPFRTSPYSTSRYALVIAEFCNGWRRSVSRHDPRRCTSTQAVERLLKPPLSKRIRRARAQRNEFIADVTPIRRWQRPR